MIVLVRRLRAVSAKVSKCFKGSDPASGTLRSISEDPRRQREDREVLRSVQTAGSKVMKCFGGQFS